MSTKYRDITFDVVRALCIVEVVCFWHLTNYIDNSFISERVFEVFGWVTTIVMGTFAFMSSYFLKRKKMENRKDVSSFYIARFKRFWLLYFIASTLLYVASFAAGQPWYPSVGNFVLSLFGLTMFFQPMPPTLWYMVMLMFFYIITPPIQLIKSIKWKWVAVIALYVLLCVMQWTGWCDMRIVWYFPLYMLGLLLPDGLVAKMKGKPFFSLVAGVALIALVSQTVYDSPYFSAIIGVAGFPVVFAVSELLAKMRIVSRVATFVSYASLCMYLFHRHFYLGLVIIWGMGAQVDVRDATFPLWFAFLVACPMIILGAWLIQRIYDHAVNCWWK